MRHLMRYGKTKKKFKNTDENSYSKLNEWIEIVNTIDWEDVKLAKWINKVSWHSKFTPYLIKHSKQTLSIRSLSIFTQPLQSPSHQI